MPKPSSKKCEFEVKQDQCLFRTRTNGDHISFDKVHVDPDNAADLAWLIASGKTLTVTIKAKGD